MKKNTERSFVFDNARLDIIVGDRTPLYLDIIVAPDRSIVAFRIRKEGTNNENWQGAYE
jgi:hypothetical protein